MAAAVAAGSAVIRGCAWLLLLGALAGCYRIASPPQLGEDLSVRIVPGEARLVRAQGLLQSALAEAVDRDLGWSVHPAGSARLEVVVHEETIRSAGRDGRGITDRWRVTVRATALLVSRRGTATRDISGVATMTGTADEPEALLAAARSVATEATVWLADEVRRMPPP